MRAKIILAIVTTITLAVMVTGYVRVKRLLRPGFDFSISFMGSG